MKRLSRRVTVPPLHQPKLKEPPAVQREGSQRGKEAEEVVFVQRADVRDGGHQLTSVGHFWRQLVVPQGTERDRKSTEGWVADAYHVKCM